MNTSDQSKAALKRAIAVAGSQAELARWLGIQPSYIGNWKSRDKKGVPAEWVAKLSEVTGIPCYEFRPDVFRREPPLNLEE